MQAYHSDPHKLILIILAWTQNQHTHSKYQMWVCGSATDRRSVRCCEDYSYPRQQVTVNLTHFDLILLCWVALIMFWMK
jgi:hypothetical protein